MNDTMTAMQVLCGADGHPPQILIRGEGGPRIVTGVREIDGGAVLAAGEREITVRAHDVWAGRYIAPTVVQVDATDERGASIQIRMLDCALVAHSVTRDRRH